jgi:hypothetical protein
MNFISFDSISIHAIQPSTEKMKVPDVSLNNEQHMTRASTKALKSKGRGKKSFP